MDFRQKLYNFMAGRYGFDELGKFLFSAGIATWVICLVLRFLCFFIPFLYYVYAVVSPLNTIVYVIAIFRILSRNLERRRRENEKFLDLRDRIRYPKDKSGRQKNTQSDNGYKEVKYRPANETDRESNNRVKERKPKKDREHIFRKCPNCGTNLRLKKLRGRHNTVCPRCGTGFSVRVWF